MFQQDVHKLGSVLSELHLLLQNKSKPPDFLILFELLSKMQNSIQTESKDSLLALQRRCEDALQDLIIIGSPPPIRRLVAHCVVKIIELGDSISIYSRVSSLQGLLADKSLKPASIVGVANCLGALSLHHGSRIMSGLSETIKAVSKIIRSADVDVRLSAIQLSREAAQGMRGGGPISAYSEAVKLVTRYGVSDKSAAVRSESGKFLESVSVVGGPGLAGGGIEPVAAMCLKGLEDPVQIVRDSFASALGSIVALGLNPKSQIISISKGTPGQPKSLDTLLQKFLSGPFTKASSLRTRDIRMGLAIAWVSFLQGMRLTYGLSDSDLVQYTVVIMGLLAASPRSTIDPHAQACVLYILRVGIVEQLDETAQKQLIKPLTDILAASESSPAMMIASLRTLSSLLAILGEVNSEECEDLKTVFLLVLSNPSALVRTEAAFCVQTLAEIEPSCVDGILKSGLKSLKLVTDGNSGDRKKSDLDLVQGQAGMLASILVLSPKLDLGIPSEVPESLFVVSKKMILHPNNSVLGQSAAERQAGWTLIASVLTLLPKKTIAEKELEFLALWGLHFGVHCVDRLKKMDSSALPFELSGCVAAMDALRAFITTYIVPEVQKPRNRKLLKSVLTFLSGSLLCVTSPFLSQSAGTVRSLAELLVIQTLKAYLALPDAQLYKSDHTNLMALCSSPFRDGSAFPASSCLRHLLSSRDHCLGPWVPGRDSLEDELRAFRGGSDAVVPSVWEQNTSSAFPQPISQSTAVVDAMLLSFTAVFPCQDLSSKQHFLELIIDCLKAGKKQPWRIPSAVNVCVVMIGILRNMATSRRNFTPELWNHFQLIAQGVLAADSSHPAFKRAAAETLGLLARLSDDSYASRLARSLLTDAQNPACLPQKSAIALAIGIVRQSIGGMALSALIGPSVQLLCALSRDESEDIHTWALHGLWLTIDAAGLSYIPFVQATLSLAMDVLMSESHSRNGSLFPSIGRLVNALVAVLGPELVPGSSVFSRCKSIVADISSASDPAAQLECVLYTQQLVLFAPQALPFHFHVSTLRPTLSSRQPSLRLAAIATLRHMSERDPVAMCEQRIEEDLFAMLDHETNERVVKDVSLTLERLLEADSPMNPQRWLNLFRNVVLATAATKQAGQDKKAPGSFHQDSSQLGEDDESGMVNSTANQGAEKHSSASEQLPRFRTRYFAAQCLSRLPSAVGSDPAHFDLVLAKETQRQYSESQDSQLEAWDWLVLHLGELVALAYQVATGSLERVRPLGINLIMSVLQKFARSVDPEYEGHYLLEQYQAQFLSTVRSAFESTASPLLTMAGAQLAAQMVTSGMAGDDLAVIQRIITLVSQPVLSWNESKYGSYAEWVGVKVKLELLRSLASMKCFLVPHEGEKTALLKLFTPQIHACWVATLADFAAAKMAKKRTVNGESALLSNALEASPAVLGFLESSWGVVLAASVQSSSEGEDCLGLDVVQYAQVFGLCVFVICQAVKVTKGQPRSSTVKESETLGALRALKQLTCDACFRAGMLSEELCAELLEVLLEVEASKQVALQAEVVGILEQIVGKSPGSFWDEGSSLAMPAAELALSILHRLLSSEPTDKAREQSLLVSVVKIVGSLADRLDPQTQATGLPQFQCALIRALSLCAPTNASLPAVTAAVEALAGCVQEKRGQLGVDIGLAEFKASFLASTTESLCQLAERLSVERPPLALDARQVSSPRSITKTDSGSSLDFRLSALSPGSRRGSQLDATAGGYDDEVAKRLPAVLCALAAIAGEVPEVPGVDRDDQMRYRSWDRTRDLLQASLESEHYPVQVAALQALRSLLQSASATSASNREWALWCMQHLTLPITNLIYKAVQSGVESSSSANSAMEALKVLLLLHSLLALDSASASLQTGLLTLLLHSAIACAHAAKGHPSVASLVVRMLERLASSAPAQIQAVTAALPLELKAQLQVIIRSASSAAAPAAQPPAVTAPAAPRVPAPLKQTFSAPKGAARVLSLPPPPAVVPVLAVSADEDDDDDWDDFQSMRATKSASVKEGSAETGGNGGSGGAGLEDDEWDDFQDFKGPEQEEGDSEEGLAVEERVEAGGVEKEVTGTQGGVEGEDVAAETVEVQACSVEATPDSKAAIVHGVTRDRNGGDRRRQCGNRDW